MPPATNASPQADHPRLSIASVREEMADDARDSDAVSPTAPGIGTAPVPPKKFPKGVVLGKDGKPYVSQA
jgi:hypothetical protein